MTARCTRAASWAGRASGPAPWRPTASLAVRPPGGQLGRPATRRPRQPIRPAQGGVGFGRRPLFVRGRPCLRRPGRPGRPGPTRPRATSARRARGAPAPPSLAIPRGGPMPPPFAKDVSEKGILRDSLFRNVLCEGGGLFPFQKRPLREGWIHPLRSALRHARRHLGPSLPHLSRGHFPLRPLGLSSLEVGEVSCLPDSPCALSASASAFVRAASSASSCSSI